jgi:hypothetical protein
MKKLLQFVLAVTLMFTAIESKAQLTNGSIANDFTFPDLNGNTQHLYALLDSGYTVFIDVSAAWCGPCWAYHNGTTAGTSGVPALDGLYAAHGPAGTNDVRVLLIEGELTNTTAQLHGITGTIVPNTGYNDDTQGDWVTGTPYPIVDLSSATPGAGSFLSSYSIAYFPTIYMICPDRSVTLAGQVTAAVLYADKGACMTATNPDDAQMMLSTSLNIGLQGCDSVTPQFRIGNLGTTNLTSATLTYKVDGTTQKVINWTGSIAPYGNTVVTGVKVGSLMPGTHTASVVVSNPNGGTDLTASDNTASVPFLIYTTAGAGTVTESFESGAIPSSWANYNGGSTTTWVIGTTGAGGSAHSMHCDLYNTTSGDIDYEEFPLSFAGISAPVLTFDIANAQSTSTSSDKFEVDISVDCGAHWVPRYVRMGAALATAGVVATSFTPTLPSQWRHETVTLTPYANQSGLLMRFKTVSAAGNNVWIDNINVGMAAGIATYTSPVESVNIFPNPAADNTNVNFTLSETNIVTISLFNLVGQLVSTESLGKLAEGEHTFNFSTEELKNGLYFITVRVGNESITKKVTITR